jgi:hypothetical protein
MKMRFKREDMELGEDRITHTETETIKRDKSGHITDVEYKVEWNEPITVTIGPQTILECLEQDEGSQV